MIKGLGANPPNPPETLSMTGMVKTSQLLRSQASRGPYHTSGTRFCGHDAGTELAGDTRQSAAHHATGTVLLRLLNMAVIDEPFLDWSC